MQQNYSIFSDLYRQIEDMVQDRSANFENFIKNEINRLYLMACQAHDWPQLRKLATNLSVSAGASHIYMPSDCANVLALIDITNDEFWNPSRLEGLLYEDASIFDESGFTLKYSDAGDSAILRDYLGAATLYVDSTHSSDTGQICTIGGMSSEDTGSVFITETITLNGTVAVATNRLFNEIHFFTVNSDHDGQIRLQTDAPGTIVYANIGKHDRTVRYKKLRISPLAGSAITVAAIYKRDVSRLVNDGDVVQVPIGGWLFDMGVMRAKQYDQNDVSASQFYELALAQLEALIGNTSENQDRVQSRPMPRQNLRDRALIFRTNA